MKQTVAFYGSTRSYRASFELEGWGDRAEQLHRLSVQQRWGEMSSLVSEEMVRAFAVVGTYREIADVMKKRLAGVNRFEFEIPIRTDQDRGAAREIIQDLRRA